MDIKIEDARFMMRAQGSKRSIRIMDVIVNHPEASADDLEFVMTNCFDCDTDYSLNYHFDPITTCSDAATKALKKGFIDTIYSAYSHTHTVSEGKLTLRLQYAVRRKCLSSLVKLHKNNPNALCDILCWCAKDGEQELSLEIINLLHGQYDKIVNDEKLQEKLRQLLFAGLNYKAQIEIFGIFKQNYVVFKKVLINVLRGKSHPLQRQCAVQSEILDFIISTGEEINPEDMACIVIAGDSNQSERVYDLMVARANIPIDVWVDIAIRCDKDLGTKAFEIVCKHKDVLDKHVQLIAQTTQNRETHDHAWQTTKNLSAERILEFLENITTGEYDHYYYQDQEVVSMLSRRKDLKIDHVHRILERLKTRENIWRLARGEEKWIRKYLSDAVGRIINEPTATLQDVFMATKFIGGSKDVVNALNRLARSQEFDFETLYYMATHRLKEVRVLAQNAKKTEGQVFLLEKCVPKK